uniref:5-formyltetrahydrofolate cyclo-ligase n=1 Tax=Magnetococcus massalia (strain MO-1) TaxID=451514 RepID=A0A1S7LMX3_MAGMO|nr:5-formyltetrahydrofolate cyclo-ligase [Candidatus Magnetococcus massalia]
MQKPSFHKQQLRQQLLAWRRGLEITTIQHHSRAICDHIAASPPFSQSHHIAAYCAIQGEVDLSSLFQHCHNEHKSLYLPVVQKASRHLIFRQYQMGSPLQEGPFGTLHPPAQAPTLHGEALRTLQLILLPLVGFDHQGYRLGYGGGYYDQTLGTHPHPVGPLRVGVAYEGQRVERIPREEHDQRLDAVVTERGWFTLS